MNLGAECQISEMFGGCAQGCCHRVHVHAAMVFHGSCMSDVAIRALSSFVRVAGVPECAAVHGGNGRASSPGFRKQGVDSE